VRSVARRSGGIFWIEHATWHAPHSSLLPSSPMPFTLAGDCPFAETRNFLDQFLHCLLHVPEFARNE
jgi:hypothetical protein